jgi:hypothetical protein
VRVARIRHHRLVTVLAALVLLAREARANQRQTAGKQR